jgi:hypothetical protein
MISKLNNSKKDQSILISITLSFSALFLILQFISGSIFSYELGPGAPSCWELGKCDLFSNPLNAMLQPWVDDFTVNGVSVAFILIWGIILGIIWLRTHHTMIVGIVGMGIAALYTTQAINSIDPKILLVGGTLLAVSAGILIYQLIVVRLNYPTG